MAPRVVSGPEITGLVTNKQTGTPIGGATVTVSATVYTDPDFTSGTTTLTADGSGVFFCYATNGTYTFTTTAAGAGPIESVTVRGSGGGGGGSGAYTATDAQVWSARDHGVLGDGVTDDTVAIKAFLNATIAAGATAFFPSGSYVSSWFYITGAPRIFAMPGTVKILMSQSNDGWNFGPTTYGTTTTLTADAAAGATSLSLTALPSGVAVGSIIVVGDTSLLVGGNSATNTAPANNLYRVTAVSGSGPYTVTIAGGTSTLASGTPTPQGLIYPITAATGVVTALPNMQADPSVRGLSFVSTAGASNTASAVTFRQMRNLDVDVSCTGFGNANLLISDCWSVRVHARINQALNIDVSGVGGQFGYGIDIAGATAHADINVICDQARHAISFAGTGHNCRVQGVATNTTSTAFDAHAGFTNVQFDGCIADGCVSGFALRGDRYRINGGSVDNCYSGVGVFDRPISVSIKGLHVKNTTNGVLINSVGSAATPGQGLTIDGCTFDDSLNAAIDFASTSSAFTDVRIVNNCFRNSGKTVSAPHIYVGAALTRARVHRNLFEDNQGSATTTAAMQVVIAATDATFYNNDLQNSLTGVIGSQAGTFTQAGSIFTPQATSYTAAGNYTYTVPSGATRLTVFVNGGGGGGGSGRVSASGTVAFGGTGGGGGSSSQITLPVSGVTSTVAVTVGAGGAGGVAQATDSTNGNNGSGGQTSSFGTYVLALGGSNGAGGTTTSQGNSSGGVAMFAGGSGASNGATNGNGANPSAASGGGGAGGTVTAAVAAGTGGSGAKTGFSNQGNGGTAGAAGAAGGAGNAQTSPGYPGTGGGGGGASTTGVGGAGGAGSAGGGGGAGGGAALNGNGGSGAGGAGGAGSVYIYAS